MRRHRPTILCGGADLLCGHAGASRRRSAGQWAVARVHLRRRGRCPPPSGRRGEAPWGVDILDGIGSTEMLHIFLSNQPGRAAIRHLRPRGARLRIARGRCGWAATRRMTSRANWWCAGTVQPAATGTSARKSRRTFVGDWTYTGDKYIRQPDGVLPLLRPHRRHVQGQRHLGQPIRGGDSPGVPRRRAGGGGGRPSGRRRAGEAARLRGAEAGAGCGGRPGRGAEAACQGGRPGRGNIPRWIEFVDDLPKTATGKVQRFKLREEA